MLIITVYDICLSHLCAYYRRVLLGRKLCYWDIFARQVNGHPIEDFLRMVTQG